MNAARSSTAREWLVIAVLTLAGAVLRVWEFPQLGLEHFDEGIYAFAGLWSVARHGLFDLDPGVIAYAPPGFPILVGLAYVLFGVSDHAAIAVSVAAGIATIPVVGWLGRKAFGPGAGAAAATFAALSMAHVAFSRKALTDTSFLLAWLIAIGMAMRFLERPGFLRALALGLAVGVAQNFKYNGWLAGAIVVVAAASGAAFRQEQRERGPLLRTFGWGLAAAVMAALVYAPWYAFVAAHGGYADLLRHQRSYLGSGTWSENWTLQLGQAFALSGQWRASAMTGLIAWLAYLTKNRGWPPWWQFSAGAGLLTLFGAFPGYFPWWLGLGWTPWLLIHANPSFRVLGGWWLVTSALTPLYHPYARLWLPLHALGWLLTAGFAAVVPSLPMSGSRLPVALAVTGAACGATAVMHVTTREPQSVQWSEVLEPVAGLRQFAWHTLPLSIREQGATLRLYARRPLAFYLSLGRPYPFQLEPTLERAIEEKPAGSWGVIDELMPGDYPFDVWPIAVVRVGLDPITALDHKPWRAFTGIDRPGCNVILLPPHSERHP
jgi:4-amino-4-deoxy-L-arabinose transferase-like glycosyltransferase